MATNPLRNIPLKTFRDFLEWNGLQYIRTNGGHEIWNKAGLNRPGGERCAVCGVW